jgi:Clp amino terminal domain, pathogenicity island component
MREPKRRRWHKLTFGKGAQAHDTKPSDDAPGGSNVFGMFTDGARQVVILAQEEARILNQEYVSSEHMLLGLLREGKGVGSKALESLGVTLAAARQQVERVTDRGLRAGQGNLPFTQDAKNVLVSSLREALELGHNYIATEHILLGLIHNGEDGGAEIIVKLGADLSRVRQAAIQMLDDYDGNKTTDSEEPEPPEYVKEVERDLLNMIIRELEKARMSPEQAKQLAKDFLALLPAQDANDITDKLVRLMQVYPQIELIWLRHTERWPLLEQMSAVQAMKEAAIDQHDFGRAIHIRSEEKHLLKRMQELTPLYPKKNTRPNSAIIEPILQRHFERIPLLTKIFTVVAMKEEAIDERDFDSAARLREEEKQLTQKLHELTPSHPISKPRPSSAANPESKN